jgi:hypothetical protein
MRAMHHSRRPAKTHDPPTDFIESCALQVPVRPDISLPSGCRSEWVTTGVRWLVVIEGNGATEEGSPNVHL